jgi:exodeoxyribonuclease-5
MTTEITLYPEQQTAKDLFLAWWNNGNPTTPIFHVFGYAGTGKSFVTNEMLKEVEGLILFAAFTGKAALVMTKHGNPASTIHSLIYKPILPDKQHYEGLKRSLVVAKEENDTDMMKELYDLMRNAQSISFELNDESPLKDAALFVLDECMMVDDELLKDILSFGVPLLVLGDPGQLSPIYGTGALFTDNPAVFFTEIHRQALDNPIIKMSFEARNGRAIPLGEYGDSSHIRVRDLTKRKAMNFGQILTGKNITRRAWNRKMRGILGFVGNYPIVGDKLICLRNQKQLGLFNGLLCNVKEVMDEYENFIEMVLTTELDREVVARVHRAHFDEYCRPGTLESLKWWDFQNTEEFDFGYAITVHKSQGSQWDHIGFYDDKFLSWKKPERQKWLYTGITRAAETVTLIS